MITEYVGGYDFYDEGRGDSVGVTEILYFKDLSYITYFNDEPKKIRFLSKQEALNKFGYISEEVKNKILNYDNKNR